jgi:hypothetical protein
MNRAQLATTITRKNAGVEPPWMVSRHVVANCARFTSLAVNVTAVYVAKLLKGHAKHS